MRHKHLLLPAARASSARPIIAVRREDLPALKAGLGAPQRAWIEANGFAGEAGKWIILPGAGGKIEQVLLGAGNGQAADDPFQAARLASGLPAGDYRFEAPPGPGALVALGWLMETYAFTRYGGKEAGNGARLVCPGDAERADVIRQAEAVSLVRDLVNTPASDMGPDELQAAAGDLAGRHGARFRVVVGKRLAAGFPMIHAVGRASARAPRLIDFTWGDPKAAKVTLVGKGVTFDTGGLDIKPSSNMALMKKDMGGAANVLGLASMIMDARLPVRLRVLIPAVENAISGEAFRPGDVLKSRKGLTVEIGNTDAEGRLVLADALALADAESPDLIIDMATLTGAARVALGPDVAPFFTDDEAAAAALAEAAGRQNDPLWRLPLWRPYNALFESRIADLNNAGSSGFAGSITAALFLRRFVEKARAYVHLDIFAWTPVAKPGRPMGGEAQGIRALYAVIAGRYR
jgi:leucyl aminopeptidase